VPTYSIQQLSLPARQAARRRLRAIALPGRTVINLWRNPPCLPDDPPWAAIHLGR